MTTEDIIFGLAFVAIVEGLVLALAPSRFGEMLRKLDDIPLETRRMLGLSVVAFGILVLWFLRA